ncbi:enoyl-CoA hydratase/isomerase family protein [Variovorax sp. 1615]|uniref:enoyl-CoA hydratase/isomerase family protein n=1 Tax=Variovorax sp. UC122_21 TaxID=3374554 RepID=UPI001AE115FE
MDYVTLETSDGIAHVRLQRPERLNAISAVVLDDLHEALREAQSSAEVRAIVFSGAGRAFCAGDDLKEFGEQTRTPASIRHHIERIQTITRDLMFGGKPVIGAIHGFAVGGGFEWLLNCDLVVASEDLVCFFPEMDWGQFVTGGVTWLLPQAVGHQRAMELWLLGERQSAADLLRLGLANWVVPPERVLARAFEVAAVVASKSQGSVSRLKRVVTMQAQSNLAVALELEQEATVAAFATPDAAERVLKFGRRA